MAMARHSNASVRNMTLSHCVIHAVSIEINGSMGMLAECPCICVSEWAFKCTACVCVRDTYLTDVCCVYVFLCVAFRWLLVFRIFFLNFACCEIFGRWKRWHRNPFVYFIDFVSFVFFLSFIILNSMASLDKVRILVVGDSGKNCKEKKNSPSNNFWVLPI